MDRPHWNDPANKAAYWWVVKVAQEADGFTTPILWPESLSNEHLKTRSKRISRMLKLAYYLGELRGIKIADEFKDEYELR